MTKYFVYVLMFKNKDYFYIGSTMSMKERFSRHKRELSSGTHHNVNLQKIHDDGYELFVDTVMSCQSKDEMVCLEESLIQTNADNELMLNINLSSTFGDTKSKHPNREDIIRRTRETLREHYKFMTKEERRRRFGNSGPLNGMYGKHHTEETKRIISEKNRGKTPPNKGIAMTKERYDIHMKSMSKRDSSGENNPFFGKKHSEVVREKLRKSATGRKSSRRLRLSVDGVIFDSYTSASEKLKIPIVTIRHRCLSTNPKFSEWILL